MNKSIFLFIVLTISMAACKNVKNTSSNNLAARMSIKKLNNIIDRNAFDYKYFSTKARVNLDKQSFTANFRMKKDEVIWISLTGPFNIEGARVLITPGRFQMINKLEASYYDMPLSFVEKYIPITADLALLQDLIVGNVLEKTIKKQKIETKDNSFVVKGDIAKLNTVYTLNYSGRPQNIDIQEEEALKMVNIIFDKYEKVDNQDFAIKRKYLIKDEEKNYLLDLKFYKHQFSTVDFPFKIPSGYTTYN